MVDEINMWMNQTSQLGPTTFGDAFLSGSQPFFGIKLQSWESKYTAIVLRLTRTPNSKLIFVIWNLPAVVLIAV